MEQTKTKKALIMSVLSVFLCIAMLIGMTFAWFTDTASTGVNKIQAGNLKVDIVDATTGNSIKNESIYFVNNTGSKDILWEPGATFKTTGFKIKNLGNLALKYKLALNGVTGDNELLDVITFSVVDVAGNTVNLDTFEGKLTAEGTMSDVLYIQGHMDESAGNEYQGLSIEGIAITVYATQDTVEFDSFNNNYDKNATYYPVIDLKGLNNALSIGGNVAVDADVTVYNTDSRVWRTTVDKPTMLTLNKKIISPDNMGDNRYNFAALFINADTTINAGVDGGIDTGTNGAYAINVNDGATLTINGGYYYGGGTAVQVQKGTLIINSGTFACEPFSGPNYNFLINCVDSAYNSGDAKVSIKGGTFINFDPSNNAAEGTGTNFVADGYKVVSETHGTDIWYKVIAE